MFVLWLSGDFCVYRCVLSTINMNRFVRENLANGRRSDIPDCVI